MDFWADTYWADTYWADTYWPIFILIITPPCRTHTIPYEDRTLEVLHEIRTYTIPYEDRTLEVKC